MVTTVLISMCFNPYRGPGGGGGAGDDDSSDEGDAESEGRKKQLEGESLYTVTTLPHESFLFELA